MKSGIAQRSFAILLLLGNYKLDPFFVFHRLNSGNQKLDSITFFRINEVKESET